LEAYLQEKHFRYLGLLLLVMDIIYVYFTLSEYLTMAYGDEVADQRVMQLLFVGDFAPAFWAMILGGFVLPALMLGLPSLVKAPTRAPALLARLRPLVAVAAGFTLILVVAMPGSGASAAIQIPLAPSFARILGIGVALGGLFWMALPPMRAHPIATIVTASVLVNVAMWLKRYIIIVPTLYSPRIPIQNVPWEWAHYQPSWVEWSITAGAFATFILLYTLFSKMFPVVSIWETSEEGDTHA
jgi:hypothetical protein